MTPALLALLGVIVGAVVTHVLAEGRDRRKEDRALRREIVAAARMVHQELNYARLSLELFEDSPAHLQLLGPMKASAWEEWRPTLARGAGADGWLALELAYGALGTVEHLSPDLYLEKQPLIMRRVQEAQRSLRVLADLPGDVIDPHAGVFSDLPAASAAEGDGLTR